MSTYRGDIALGDTIDIKFSSRRFSSGVPFTLAGSPVVAAYVNNSTTEITAGITLTVDFDARVGLHNVRVVATAANGFTRASEVSLVLTAGTVDSVSVVGEQVGAFSIENRATPAHGIVDRGTAQSATATSLVLRSAAAFANNTLVGMMVLAYGSTQGYWQSRVITANVLATDTVTVDTWDVTPSGTIDYIIVGTPPASTALPAAVNIVKVNNIQVTGTGEPGAEWGPV